MDEDEEEIEKERRLYCNHTYHPVSMTGDEVTLFCVDCNKITEVEGKRD